jgi:Uma2 family endonuclease
METLMSHLTIAHPRATLDDLYDVEGKAELIGGKIVRLMPTGELPGDVGGGIYASLRQHAKRTGKGKAYPHGVGYAVPELTSGRESFCPDTSYFDGPTRAAPAQRMRFIQGAPKLAVEVRSEKDYGPAAETAISAKRGDYFAAGTGVVWDVDPLAQTVAVYRAADPNNPTVYGIDDVAEAEPAVPGWELPLREIFEQP